jgi:hypothetical protein
VKGRFQVPYKNEYIDSTISLTRFYGGDSGNMLQITTYTDYGHCYIQLTKDQVSELTKMLNNCFDKEIYPSE